MQTSVLTCGWTGTSGRVRPRTASSLASKPLQAHPRCAARLKPATALGGAPQSSRPVAAGITGPKRLRPLQAAQAPAGSKTTPPSPDDVVIVHAVRTALCKANTGGFKDTPVDDLVIAVFQDILNKTHIEPEAVGDIAMGAVMCESSKRANEVRMASLVAGFPDTVPIYTVNRQCGSGLQAIVNTALNIKAGTYDIGIAGGVESMTTNPFPTELGEINPRMKENQEAMDCLLPMGVTSENVAEHYGVTREAQDAFAAASHAKAAAARESGKFREEIVPVATKFNNPKSGQLEQVVIQDDDGIHPDFTPQKLARHKPVFKKGGTTTPGNSSQVTDGAAAVLLMRRAEAERRGLKPMAKLRSFVVTGVAPAVMGIGPAEAIPKAVEKAGLTLDDIDVFEINEAFASQASYCVAKLGLDESKVNPNGGAIALGHPLGCTGARLTVTLLHEMCRRGKDARFGVASMCMASGMGAAAVFEQDVDGQA